MHPDLAVVPMEHRPELDQRRILQVSEGLFHMVLAPVARDDLLVRPTGVVREQNALPRTRFRSS